MMHLGMDYNAAQAVSEYHFCALVNSWLMGVLQFFFIYFGFLFNSSSINKPIGMYQKLFLFHFTFKVKQMSRMEFMTHVQMIFHLSCRHIDSKLAHMVP